MFLLGCTFSCVVDGVVMSFMGKLVTYHITILVTLFVGGLGVFPGVGTVQVKRMFGHRGWGGRVLYGQASCVPHG